MQFARYTDSNICYEEEIETLRLENTILKAQLEATKACLNQAENILDKIEYLARNWEDGCKTEEDD